MKNRINITTSVKYNSIQEGFEWQNIPQFAIITGVNGAGKTQLLNILSGVDNQVNDLGRGGHGQNYINALYKIENLSGDAERFILPISHNNQSIELLIEYFKDRNNRLVRKRQLENNIMNYKNTILAYENQKQTTSEKIEQQRLDIEIKSYEGYIQSEESQISSLLEYAYEVELKKVSDLVAKEIDELTVIDINKYANPIFNHLTEIEDFSNYIGQEESEIYECIKQCSKERNYNEIPRYEEAERAYQKINQLFIRYGFTYFEMLDPYPKDKSRKGEVLFEGKAKEQVKYHMLSSGEQMIVKFVIWAMGKDIRGNRINTMILDEPDAHLHPAMCKMMVEILTEISKPKEEGGSGIRVIMSTHSPSTVAFAPEGSLFVMEKDDQSNRYITPTSSEKAVEILSNGIFTFQKAINQFSIAANSIKNNLLFVEGKTDVPHLYKAMEMLDYKLDVEIIDLHDAGALANFIKSTPAKLFNGKKIIALFDSDKEGITNYKSIKGDESVIGNVKRLTATQCDQMSYALTIQPVLEMDRYCPIEFLYIKEYLKVNEMLNKMSYPEYQELYKGSNADESKKLIKDFENETSLKPFKVNDNMKTRFSENIINEKNKAVFDGFKNTLELIRQIIEL